MKKVIELKTVNLLIAGAFALLAATSLLPKIAPDLAEVSFEIHEYTGYLFFFLALAHIALNWSWVKSNFLKKSKAPLPLKPASEKKEKP
jgi:cytochrome b561